ncbi:MAG: toxin-antitoxin system HicB family antitoxin [Pirellulales bacterium]
MTKEAEILDSARDVAASVDTWADLSNALFDPEHGLVARAYPTRDERERFLKTDEYQAIRRLINDAKHRTGLIAGATPKKSGKFVVRLPRTLHAALEIEAEEEGVSLNQLVLTKLAVPITRLFRAGDGPDCAGVPQNSPRAID